MTARPMFPLGTVLFPSMPAVLRVFEERYLAMLASVLQEEPAEFGVVLIERGMEVGGGDHRFRVGTFARITQLMQGEGFVGLVAEGAQRFEVERWLPDDPYPRAEVRLLPDLEWDESFRPLLEETERVVRRVLAQASEFAEQRWSADVELVDDPVAAAWQLAGIAPLGELDQVALLRASTVEGLLTDVQRLATAALETLTSSLLGDDDGLDQLGEP
ncbi:LON peptidase substrate-binding domain-containing protein [Naasia sp. SYSU D00057]|uniref:LON peptidase substrate-binding domain-containing protein n=1 Tax=Naasia sp. SYSU D00057 TaxID=2817380 RepID=UPI001B3178A9|nr:LON peptidase substrate-binding domain-containing protein [Naasia sp. SYSU D00057]